MRYFYFGIPQPGNWILDGAKRMDCPEGQLCEYCIEEIKFEDAGYAVSLSASGKKLFAHNNCFLVAMGVIPAYPWHEEEGSAREVADAAVKEWLEDTQSRRRGQE